MHGCGCGCGYHMQVKDGWLLWVSRTPQTGIMSGVGVPQRVSPCAFGYDAAIFLTFEPSRQNNNKMVRWPRENLVELIAWLDFSLSHEGINFSDTIADHLKASCDKEYTFEQVERKLRSVWSSHGPKTDSQYTWLDVYNHGSQILSRLTDEQLDAIARAHARLEDGATAKLLAVRERPRTRSASKSGNFRFSPHISLENFQTKQSPQYYKRQHTGSVTPCPAKRESEPVDLGTYEGLTPPKRAKKSSPLVYDIFLKLLKAQILTWLP